MATLKIDTNKIISNINKLNSILDKHNIKWTLVTKMLSGYKPVLEKILCNDSIKNLHSVGDARISNLKAIKQIKSDIVTMYIKPPAIVQAKNVVKYADISLNSSYKTIEALNKEAEKQNKIHKVVVMIEMGELREGILRENILSFYEKVFNMPNIEIIGLGTNLGCMYGVEPTYDKLIQLSLYKQLIDSNFKTKLELISSGSSITLPLLSKNKIPEEINHFRIGETAFLGVSPYNGKKFRNLSTKAFDFSAEIIELEKKDLVPDGNIGDGGIGYTAEIEHLKTDELYRCILDFGEIDVEVDNLTQKDPNLNFIGTTSDMTVYAFKNQSSKYKVGNQIHFTPNYMAVARIMNSRYITKKVI